MTGSTHNRTPIVPLPPITCFKFPHTPTYADTGEGKKYLLPPTFACHEYLQKKHLNGPGGSSGGISKTLATVHRALRGAGWPLGATKCVLFWDTPPGHTWRTPRKGAVGIYLPFEL